MARAHVQVILADERIPAGLDGALQRVNASASFWPLTAALRAGTSHCADAVVVVLPNDPRPITSSLRVLFDRMADQPRGTLVCRHDLTAWRMDYPTALPLSFADGAGETELAARLATLLEMRPSFDSLHRRAAERRAAEHIVRRRFRRQLELAGRIQRELASAAIPPVGRVRFDVLNRAANIVSGDLVDFIRFDGDHVGLVLLDAAGEGLPAALLSVFGRRAIRREENDGVTAAPAPADVLHRLNDELLRAELNECAFVAALVLILNARTLEYRFARAGMPYPLLRRADGSLAALRSGGGLLGVLSTLEIEEQEGCLHDGDALLLRSDGLDRILLPTIPAQRVGVAMRRAAEFAALGGDIESALDAECTEFEPDLLIARTLWHETLRQDGPFKARDEAAGRWDTLRRIGAPLDDLTLITILAESHRPYTAT